MSEQQSPSVRRPAGLDAVNAVCRTIYQDQPNPLQVTALVKFWLGGPDPLDYISIYANPGDSTRSIPPHWHYVSFGLTDLHGDGRVHERAVPSAPSGFGFELTFRLKREKSEQVPPTWPAEIMQSLARYVFQSENVLCVGDHISWHAPLDHGESYIQHMLLAQDPQLPKIETALGHVSFVQIVGITADELKAAQQWNGPGILQLLSKHTLAGGPWLVTDMRRGETIFDIDTSTRGDIDDGVSRDGSSLSGVSAVCSWEDAQGRPVGTGGIMPDVGRPAAAGVDVHGVDECAQYELLRTTSLDRVELIFNLEAAKLLPLALRGRLKHGRHFTYKSFTGEVAITLVCPGIHGTFADEDHPFAAQGPWLQVFISEEFSKQVLQHLEPVVVQQNLSAPCKLEWPDKSLTITIMPNS